MKQHQKRMLEGSHRDSPDDDAENKEQDVAVSTMSDVEAQSGRARTSASRRRQTEESDGDDKLGEQEEEEGFLSGASFWILITLLLAAIITVAVGLYFYCRTDVAETDIVLRFEKVESCPEAPANGHMKDVNAEELAGLADKYQWTQGEHSENQAGCFQYYKGEKKAFGVKAMGAGEVEYTDYYAIHGVMRAPTEGERKQSASYKVAKVTFELSGVPKGTQMWFEPALGPLGSWYYFVDGEGGAHRVVEIKSFEKPVEVQPYSLILRYKKVGSCKESPANSDITAVTVPAILDQGATHYGWMQGAPHPEGCFEYYSDQDGNTVVFGALHAGVGPGPFQGDDYSALHGVMREPTKKERQQLAEKAKVAKGKVTEENIPGVPKGTPMWYEASIGQQETKYGGWYYYVGGLKHRVFEILWADTAAQPVTKEDAKLKAALTTFNLERKEDGCDDAPENGRLAPVTFPALTATLSNYQWLKGGKHAAGCFQYYDKSEAPQRVHGLVFKGSQEVNSPGSVKFHGILREATEEEKREANKVGTDGKVTLQNHPVLLHGTAMWYEPDFGQHGSWYYETTPPRVFEILSPEVIP